MADELEEVGCNFCGSSEARKIGRVKVEPKFQDIFSRAELDIVKCKKCGLAYTSPRPTDATLKVYYERCYSDVGSKDPLEEMRSNKETMLCGGGYTTYDTRYTGWLLGVITRLAGRKGRLLDIGFGEGQFVRFASANGWSVSGQEVSEEAVEHIKKAYGLDVKAGDLRELRLPSESFEAVTMINVIEHLSDPIGYLKEAHRILKKGGVLYISTVNAHTSRRPVELVIPEHLYHFSAEAIGKMLRKSGFEVLELTTRNHRDLEMNTEILRDSLQARKPVATFLAFKRLFEAAFGICIGIRGLPFDGGPRITAFARK
ncbi:MAG: class I SAM-dependent methyltransferase [Euryarchaeota archaeon]|nr:class I SAM-dependent methyltransferase [Euryarchaeota archaeon]